MCSVYIFFMFYIEHCSYNVLICFIIQYIFDIYFLFSAKYLLANIYQRCSLKNKQDIGKLSDGNTMFKIMISDQ